MKKPHWMRQAYDILENNGENTYFNYCSSQILLDKNNNFVDVGNRLIIDDSTELFIQLKSFFEYYSEYIKITCKNANLTVDKLGELGEWEYKDS